eukprot:6188058-Pleurochrysis_carterae.AAC.3
MGMWSNNYCDIIGLTGPRHRGAMGRAHQGRHGGIQKDAGASYPLKERSIWTSTRLSAAPASVIAAPRACA